MTIEIVTPAECNDFTTLDAVKTYFNITDVAQDAKINQGIKYASDFIRRYTGRTFAEQTIIETIRGFGTNYLTLSLFPFTNIAVILQEGEVISEYELSELGAGFIYRPGGWACARGCLWWTSAEPAPV